MKTVLNIYFNRYLHQKYSVVSDSEEISFDYAPMRFLLGFGFDRPRGRLRLLVCFLEIHF